ncbi:MAG TPA: tryptophan synthase subunit alpha [Anaerolineae bacterium]|nr:tryptophan synthase subunit alpha [Anaerolineae bacterium]
MKKIDMRIRDVLNRGEKVLVSGVPVGYPNLEETRKIVEIYIRSGIDVVEFSMPTRDPYIDTKTITDSNVKALNLEPNLECYFEALHAVRRDFPDEPFYMMAYANFILEFGLEKFVDQLVQLDIDGLELPDKDGVVPKLVVEMEALFNQKGIYRVYFLQYPFNQDYYNSVKDKINGFVILQAIADVDGERPIVAPGNRQLIEMVKNEMDTPVILGYGINNTDRVKEAVELGADGVLVGTAMVEQITQGDYAQFSKFIRVLKDATLPE